MPEPKAHADERPALEQLLRKIPGFRGYLEKQYRRESDALGRKHLADRLERAKRGLNDYALQLVSAGQLDGGPVCDRLRAKLDRLIGRIRGAMQGYSGMFDLVQIDEAVLDKVYDFDISLVDRVEILADGIEKLPAATASPTEAIAPLQSQLAAIEQEWDQREDILKGLG